MPSTWDDETRSAASEDSRKKQALANIDRPKTDIQKQRMSEAKKAYLNLKYSALTVEYYVLLIWLKGGTSTIVNTKRNSND